MIMDPVGSRYIDNGNRRAIVEDGDKPGKTPTRVPNKQPTKQYNKL
jgi:hypothetical protein